MEDGSNTEDHSKVDCKQNEPKDKNINTKAEKCVNIKVKHIPTTLEEMSFDDKKKYFFLAEDGSIDINDIDKIDADFMALTTYPDLGMLATGLPVNEPPSEFDDGLESILFEPEKRLITLKGTFQMRECERKENSGYKKTGNKRKRMMTEFDKY